MRSTKIHFKQSLSGDIFMYQLDYRPWIKSYRFFEKCLISFQTLYFFSFDDCSCNFAGFNKDGMQWKYELPQTYLLYMTNPFLMVEINTLVLWHLITRSADPFKFSCLKVAWVCMDAALSDFQTFRQPFSYQKLPLLSGTLTFEPSKPKRILLYKESSSENFSRAQNSM